MPTLPDLNRLNASARLVRPGLFCVTLSWTASFFRNERVSTFLGELIVHFPADFQSPPLLNVQIENSPCASSGPSGIA